MSNFREIAECYKIQIPIIQRDYAQGRKDERASIIREDFINSIFDALVTNHELHLNFIYGSIKERDGYKFFIPLDGQQRLTTLFLLYWYFGKKEQKEAHFLGNFTYETRASSREFCQNINTCSIDFSTKDIIDQIVDSNWYIPYWDNDPTIRSMIVMIGYIHEKFYDFSLFDNLDKITFEFFQLENYGLDDDLYVKMNARGKPLTEFENFKAKFEHFLTNLNPDLNTYFSRRIDNEWTDYFWKFAIEYESFVVDIYFMKFFSFMTEMIHFENNQEPLPERVSFADIEKVYCSENRVRFLFSILDKLEEIEVELKNTFSDHEYEAGKICLFGCGYNLLKQLITGNSLNIQQKILLFFIMRSKANPGQDDYLT